MLRRQSAARRGERAERVDGPSDEEPRLVEVAAIFQDLVKDLLRHADEEETHLFPAVLEREKGLDTSRFVEDHEAVGSHLARIRELTDGHVAPEWACNTTRSLYHSLGELEQDIHQHVHKENNTLFPRIMGR